MSRSDVSSAAPSPSKGILKRKRPLAIGALVLVVAGLAFGGFGKDPVSAQKALNAGLKADGAGNFVLAEKEYLNVLEADPENKFANFNLGLLAQKQNNKEEAENYYRQALSNDKFFLPAMFNLAILKTSRGENEEAEELYRQMIERHPQKAEPYFNLGVLLVARLDRKEEGNAFIRQAIELEPKLAARVGQGVDLGPTKDPQKAAPKS